MFYDRIPPCLLLSDLVPEEVKAILSKYDHKSDYSNDFIYNQNNRKTAYEWAVFLNLPFVQEVSKVKLFYHLEQNAYFNEQIYLSLSGEYKKHFFVNGLFLLCNSYDFDFEKAEIDWKKMRLKKSNTGILTHI